MFDSTKEDLKDLLKLVDEGRLQLPDFQRDYVWHDEDVRSLIASVARGFPIGALLTLETGGEVEFKPRLVAGAPSRSVKPDQLLLDGQQRITSLYQVTYSSAPVRTRTLKGSEVERYYYLDIEAAIGSGADIENAIIGVPADRVLRKDFGREIVLDISKRQFEYERCVFPLNQVFDSRDWFFGLRDYWRERGRDVSDLEREFYRGFVERIERYKMPIIRLGKNNSREAICLVFEKVNVGGKKLDAFELVTAIYAANGFDLREDWIGSNNKSVTSRRLRIYGSPVPRDVLAEISSTDFLKACTILHTREVRATKVALGPEGQQLPQVSCQRDALLALPLESYRKFADAVERGFIEASGFLNEHKIIWRKDVPYPSEIVALAAVFAVLGREAETLPAKRRLSRWFFSVALGELYGSSPESRLARDVPELIEWLSAGGPTPRSLDEAVFQRDRLLTMRSRLSAAYKALHALMMRQGARDFISGRPADIMTFFNDKIDIHHIFPQAWCKRQGIEPSYFNSIINKTPLSRASNLAIGGDAPSIYIKRIEQKQGLSPDALDEILRSHLIEPKYLRADKFEAFFEARTEALADVVSAAMEKPVVNLKGSNEAEIYVEVSDDPIEDTEAA